MNQGFREVELVVPRSQTVGTIVIFTVYIRLETPLHDRTAYASDFARTDKLWFQPRVFWVDFGPQKWVKSGLFGQIMLPELDIFSFTTQVGLWRQRGALSEQDRWLAQPDTVRGQRDMGRCTRP